MKKATIKFSLELGVSYPDHLDSESVCDQYLASDRFSTLSFKGEPGIVMFAATKVEESPAPKAMNTQKPPVSKAMNAVEFMAFLDEASPDELDAFVAGCGPQDLSFSVNWGKP